jgi:uncharacterized protein YecE (DUF72 family)
MNLPKIYIGTAGWSYEDWIGNFYPFGHSRDFSLLKFYARYFNLAEVNSSFYSFLSPRIVENWLAQIDDEADFIFVVKLHMDFTHRRNFNEKKVKEFKFNLDILKSAERLGGILMQFPYSFECTDANVNYLRLLIEAFEEYDKFVEVRHKSWQNKRAKTVTLCSIDQPTIGNSLSFKPSVGREKLYARFHGRNKTAWVESFKNFGKKQTYQERSARYDYLYSPGEIISFAQDIQEVYDKVKEIYVVMNNHPHGQAVANAFEMLHYLKNGEKVKMPGTIVKAFPRLKRFAEGS